MARNVACRMLIAVDFPRRSEGHADGERLGEDQLIERLARRRRQRLRIVEPGRQIVPIEDDRGGRNRAGERPAAGFVDPGDRPLRLA